MCDYHVYCKINSKWSLKFMKLGVHTIGGMQVCGGEGYPQHSLFLACLGDFVNTCTFLLMKNGRNEMNRCVHVLAV